MNRLRAHGRLTRGQAVGWLLVAVSSACRERLPPRPDAGPVPPKSAYVVVLNGASSLPSSIPEAWRAAKGWPNALLLANGLPGELMKTPSTASTLATLNVAAFTVGPRELSWGRAALQEVRARSRATWVLTNARSTWPGSSSVAVFERNRIPIAVMAVSEVAGADDFEEVPLEGALGSTIATASKQAPVVVLMVAGCSSSVAKAVRAHPEWKVDVVVAAPCDGTRDERIGPVTLLHPGPTEVASIHVELGEVRSLSASVEPIVKVSDPAR